jgi:hypothetical protein
MGPDFANDNEKNGPADPARPPGAPVNLTVFPKMVSPTATNPEAPPHDHETAMPIWMRRISLVIFVAFCLEVGLLLAVLPWTRVWTDNALLLDLPWLRPVIEHGFVRGVVSGIGLVDLWLGISEAVQYREPRRG